MDIHPPEHPIRSVRDFLLQIFTITCGIVIALLLESEVINRHEARLARETRADFVAELEENAAKVREVRAMSDAHEKWLDNAADWAEALRKHQTRGKLVPPGAVIFPSLRNAAWETSLATQAVRLLTFEETRALATAYNHQAVLNDMVVRAREQWLGLSAFDIDPAEATDDGVRDGLRELRIASAYQHSLDLLEDKVMSEYQAAQNAIAASK